MDRMSMVFLFSLVPLGPVTVTLVARTSLISLPILASVKRKVMWCVAPAGGVHMEASLVFLKAASGWKPNMTLVSLTVTVWVCAVPSADIFMPFMGMAARTGIAIVVVTRTPARII